MVGQSSGPALPFHKLFTASAIAACTAEITTLPLGARKGGARAVADEGLEGRSIRRSHATWWMWPRTGSGTAAPFQLLLPPSAAA